MIGGVVEVAQEGRYLSKHRGFLVAHEGDGEVGRVPLDQIDALVVSARSATISRSLLTAMTDQGSVVVFAGSNYEPECLVLPAQSPAHSLGHPEDQAAATLAFQGRLWKQIVASKIAHQAAVLQFAAADAGAITRLTTLSKRVKNGDPENVEASAARSYFPALFGKGFVRERDSGGLNAHLNYGYAIVRAACARSICAVGLSPALGMHHRSRRNPLCLADDLVELFRPLIDALVFDLARDGGIEDQLTPAGKRHLAAVLEQQMTLDGAVRPTTNAIHQTAINLARCYATKSTELALPKMLFQGDLLGSPGS